VSEWDKEENFRRVDSAIGEEQEPN